MRDQPLWAYIQDRETREVYRMLHTSVRTRQQPVGFCFRCDSPECRRLMAMRLLPLPAGGIAYQCRLVKAEPREREALLDPQSARSPALVQVCSWCQRVLVPQRGWLPLEEAIGMMPFFTEQAVPQCSHGICPECLASMHEIM